MASKYEVRRARKTLVMQPEAQAQAVDRLAYDQLGLRVLGANLCHVGAALRCREDVWHALISALQCYS